MDKLRALVVDDSKVMRRMVMGCLLQAELADFEFTEAENGVDALSKFDPKSIDIVFCDWNMPQMSGIDFVRKVRALGKTEHIPIVMVTSEKTMGKIEEALDDAKANAFISKPFTTGYVQRKVGPLIENMKNQPAPQSGGGFFSRLKRG